MRPEQKTKSRQKLYNAVSGANNLTGPAGLSSTWTILFNAAAQVDDLYTIGDYYFKFVADGSEDYAVAGTAADPVLVSINAAPSAANAAAEFVLAVHGFAGTNAWGYLHPDDSIGCSASTATVTLNFWPGVGPNAAGYVASTDATTPPTITNTQTGVAAPTILKDYNINVIDTTGFLTDNTQYYYLPNGDYPGQQAKVLIKTVTASDVPTIIGNFVAGPAGVTASMNASGDMAEWTWTGSAWRENIGDATGDVTYTPAS